MKDKTLVSQPAAVITSRTTGNQAFAIASSIFLALAFTGVRTMAGDPSASLREPGKTQHLASADAVPEGLTATDWSDIRAAYQAHRHQAVRTEGGYRTRNPAQQWCTEFDGRGFTTQADGAAWQWGLELKSYGFPEQKKFISQGAETTAEGGRVTYVRDPELREWFVNDRRGLEHGFTVERRPANARGAQSQLEFDLAVRGTLHPEISGDGAAVRFVDGQGRAVVTYAGLKVLDARGSQLPARFVAKFNGLRLFVDEQGARYPITVDPIAQQAYLKASNTDADDQFGSSVAVSGDTVVVGAPLETSNATGVNGNQSDNSASQAGAAYVFVRNGATWSQQAYLKASNTNAGDLFGYSVSVSDNTVVVGAISESSNATGVNGDQSNNSAFLAGAAYVFVRNGSAWSQQAYLKASNTGGADQFGFSVAVTGDTVVVGAWGEASGASGIDGNQSDNTAPASGAAYVFTRSGVTWSQQAYLKASNTGANDQFGYSVAIAGDTVVVGAYLEASKATGINGNQSDNSVPDSGAAYVFARSGTTWSQQAYLKASNTGAEDQFGWSVAISGDTVVVGAYAEASNATGINGNQSDNSEPASGAAYVFVRSGATWSQQAYLKASNTEADDMFGYSVGVAGDTVVVGAYGEDSDGSGINDTAQDDNSLIQAGAVYAFVRNGATWSQQAYLKAFFSGSNDRFGISVALSGDTLVVGASGEASNATGINGNQSDNSARNAGAAFVFTGLGSSSIPLLNISTRMNVGTGDNVLIGGFIVVGTDPKKVLLRAIGPSLTAFGIMNALANPTIELHEPGDVVVTNDNWKDTQEPEIMATGLAPINTLESAILATLDPGLYTAIVRGKNDGTGVGLVEVYDLDEAADSELANISTRGFVDIDENVMIGGFIVGNGVSTSVVVRAIGPSLSGAGVANPLQNPTLELHDGNGVEIASDDDWKDSQQAELEASGLAPSDDRESAIAADLNPGAYTAIVRGKDNTTGVGLMEVYNR